MSAGVLLPSAMALLPAIAPAPPQLGSSTNALGVGIGIVPAAYDRTISNCSADTQTADGPGPSTARSRRRWTPEEDAALVAAVAEFGCARGAASQWGKISARLSGRTNKDCRKRWFHSLDPNVRKGKWSLDEDLALRQLYAELGPQWKEIALRIPGRKDDQVSKRWRDVLSPELTAKPWSAIEDALLLQLIEEKGSRWTAIADKLPGRSPISCRNRSRKYRKTTSPKSGLSKPLDTTEEKVEPTEPVPPSTRGASALTESVATGRPTSSTGSGDMIGDDWHMPDFMTDHVRHMSFSFDMDANGVDTAMAPPSVHNDPPSVHGPPSVQNGPPSVNGHVHQHPDLSALGFDAPDPGGFLKGWLANLGTGLPTPPPAPNSTLHAPPSNVPDTAPVNNVWTLLLALDRGEPSVTVDSELLRQLVPGAMAAIKPHPAPCPANGHDLQHAAAHQHHHAPSHGLGHMMPPQHGIQQHSA